MSKAWPALFGEHWSDAEDPTVVPKDAADVRDIVALARQEKAPLVPMGGGTALRGSADDQAFLRVDLRGVVGPFEHAAEDFILTAGAGTTVAAAAEKIAARGQRLPFVVAQPERQTMGGVIALGLDGPTLAHDGALRDQLLAATIVHGDARLTHAGGKVVKNVTGYDLGRLYVGSRGTLGILTEVSLRLRPLEESRRTLTASFDDHAAALEAARRLWREEPALFAVHVVGGTDRPFGKEAAIATLVVSLAGVAPLVEALDATVREKLAPREVEATEGAAWQQLADLAPTAGDWMRLGTLPSHAARVLRVTLAAAPASARAWAVDAATGVIDLALPSPGWRPDDEVALGRELGELPVQVDRPRDPGFHRRRFEAFPGTRPDGLELMAALMRRYDPDGILNPGRFEASP